MAGFLATLPAATISANGAVQLSAGAELHSAMDVPALRQGCYLPLELDAYGRPGTLRSGSFSPEISCGAITLLDSVPFLPTSPPPPSPPRPRNNIDVGLSRWLEEKADTAEYCDRDTTRSAFDGIPESIILRVPKANYVAAHVVCAVEPDPDKIPALSLRVTRFGNHYGDAGGRCDPAFGDTTIRLPSGDAKATLPDGVCQVGEIEADVSSSTPAGKDAPKMKLPVFRVTIPLRMGDVADLLGEKAPMFGRGRDHFDIEMTKELRTAVQFFNLQNCRTKPLGLPSGVHVFAVTLERNPVDVELTSKEAGNIFYAADNPSFHVRLANQRDTPASYDMSLEVSDFHGKTSSLTQKLAAPGKGSNGGVVETDIPLTGLMLGHFDAVLTVRDGSGRELWRQPTSFALLPPDTRKAGAESPYGLWWFQGIHGTCERVDQMGPILMKMGVRHCCPYTKYNEADLTPYKLTCSMVPWHGKKPEEFIKDNPSVRLGMIFHETGVPDVSPPYAEFLGRKPVFTAACEKAMGDLWRQAEEVAKWYRANHPDIKLSFGNSPSGISVAFMRKGWPKQLVDCFGMEGVPNWMPPECPPRRGALQEVWFLAEARKLYGYEDVPVSSGYEYIGRCTGPGELMEREQADYYARDVLHCLAYGFPSINVGLTDDVADSYYATIYGSSGVLHRNPLLTPKPSYVEYATLTQVLDCAKYVRRLDTGSRSLYVLEFAKGAEKVYPMWTARGKRVVALKVQGDDGVKLVDGMGNTSGLTPHDGEVRVEACGTPMYLVTAGDVESISLEKATHEERPPENACVAGGFSDPSEWEMMTTPDTYLESYADDLPSVMGKFTVALVADDELGNVAEVAMEPQPEAPKIVQRYVSLTPKHPKKLEKEARRLGIWVKGNSCWGRIYLEFTDANGERYFSAAGETSGWDVSDWRARTSINFDGWRFVSLDIPKRYPGGYHGPTDRDWSYRDGDQDGVVQHPITMTRVVVALRDWQVYVTDMAPSTSRAIRLGGILAGE